MRKLFDNIAAAVSLDAETYTAATTGSKVIDTRGYRDGMLLVVAGDITCTTGNTYRVQLMESDTSTGTFGETGIFIDFVGASGAAAGENGQRVARISELGVTRKRFLRVDLAMTATTTSWEGTGIILMGEGVKGPVNND